MNNICKNKRVILLKTLLRSTSRLNCLKYTRDKKKRKRMTGEITGTVFLYLFITALCVTVCYGYGIFGLSEKMPAMCAMVISLISFVFTVFKTNGYLFNFKEYDMLMALPLSSKETASCKFMYMYIKSLPWYVLISVSMMIVYGIFSDPFPAVYPLWLILSLFVPVIPMLLASAIGALIAAISAGFRKTNIVQTVLTIIFITFCLSLRFIIQELFKSDQIKATLSDISQGIDKTADILVTVKWFTKAVTDVNILYALLLIAVTAALFEALFVVTGRSYAKINSKLKNHAASRKYKRSPVKKRSAVTAIAFKEFKRLTGSTIYLTNTAIGMILALIAGIVVLIAGADNAIQVVTQNAPLTKEMLLPTIPMIVYFFIGMVPTTVCSPSLEGKNYWVVKSMPVTPKQLYSGKILMNIFISVPFSVVATLCLCISSAAPLAYTLIYIVEGIILCIFSSSWGCMCGVKHMRLDWENEVEVIKQGSAVAVYLIPNILITMALTVLSVVLGMHIDPNILPVVLTLAAAGLTPLCLRKLSKTNRF